MSQLQFFTWHNILCAAFIGAVDAVSAACSGRHVFYACRFSLALRHTEPSSVHVVAVHKNMRYARQHCVRLAPLPHFKWNFSVEKKFGVLFWCTWRRQKCMQRRQLHSRRCRLCLLRSRCQQMAALNFLHFFVKWFVKIDREVTSNIKFKKT